LADLPNAIAPLVDRSKCEPVPAATTVTLTVKGPFTLCTGAFPSRERFGLMRDTSGRTVWFARSWRAAPQAVALARFDSLTRAIESRYGPATTCGHLRRVWKVEEFVLELSLESVSDAVYGSDLGIPWLSISMDKSVNHHHVRLELTSLACGARTLRKEGNMTPKIPVPLPPKPPPQLPEPWEPAKIPRSPEPPKPPITKI